MGYHRRRTRCWGVPAVTSYHIFLLLSVTTTHGFTLHHPDCLSAVPPRYINRPLDNRRPPCMLHQSAEDSGAERPPHKSKKNVRLQVFSTLQLPIVEVVSALAVLLSSLLVALGTLNDLPPTAYEVINETLLAINLVFALDFFVRWYAAGQFKAIYLTKPAIVLDIVVVLLPLILGSALLPAMDFLGLIHPGDEAFTFLSGLQNSAGLQNLLLLRVLRLRRILTDINTFGKFEVALGLSRKQDVRPYQLQLARVLLSIFTLLSVATGLIYTAEHNVNPDIPDYFSALYFGLTTLTTVGLGDIAPITPQGRLIVCGSILFGIAIIPAQTAKLVDIFVESMDEEERARKARKKKRKKQAVGASNSITAIEATNGMGPSGAAIEIPPQDTTELSSGRNCRRCGASPHRVDATFCWSCGLQL